MYFPNDVTELSSTVNIIPNRNMRIISKVIPHVLLKATRALLWLMEIRPLLGGTGLVASLPLLELALVVDRLILGKRH